MPRVNIPISNGFYVSDSLPLSAQQCSNWYVNLPQTEGALSAGNLFGCAGMSQLATTGDINQVNRGLHVKAGKPYLLNGEDLVRLDSVVDAEGVETFSTVSLGTIAGDTRVSTADNGTQLMVLIPGGNAYIIDETSGTPFVQITDPSFTANGVPQLVVFIDSFFIVTTDSKKFIRSDANNGLSWDALAVFSAESDPDIIVAPHVYRNKLYIAGSETIEEFQNVDQVLVTLETILDQEYIKTNDNIINRLNKYINVHKTNDFIVTTPALESSNSNLTLSA